MTITQAPEVAKKPSPYTPLNKITAIGLWVAALGIFIQAATGAEGYPKIPPGIIVLAAVGILVYVTARWRWASIPGTLMSGFIWIGVFATSGTGQRLGHPEVIGPFSGTMIQLAGLMVTLIAGIAGLVKSVRGR